MMTATAALALIQGVLQGLPIAIQAWEEIKSVGASGKDPTPDQWASWNAAADQASADLDAAAQQVEQQG